jgi:predicted nucleic acid-binding protein
MNVVDSSGWLAYFSRSPNAGFFTPPIRDLENLLVPAICLYEVFKRLLALRGEEAALTAAGVMALGAIVDVDHDTAISAAQISFETGLAMADSMILAIARTHDAILWTQDADFDGLEKVRFVDPGSIRRRRKRKD